MLGDDGDDKKAKHFNGTAAREPRMRSSMTAYSETLSTSMGPRLASRGCYDAVHLPVLCFILQWDRGSRAADARTAGNNNRRKLHFNGTAAREPRMRQAPRAIRPGALDFNGTAAREPRMRRRSSPRSASCRNFNGTAAREPRMPRRTNHQLVGLDPLQWDRGSRAADAPQPPRARPREPTSMGPRLASRGCSAMKNSARPIANFNGTAAREPRMHRSAGARRAAGDTSMGPRLASRGCRAGWMGDRSSLKLQWDRGSRAADAHRSPGDQCGPLHFNGTAAREPRMPQLQPHSRLARLLQWDRGSRAADAS